jgi:thioredoxin 1
MAIKAVIHTNQASIDRVLRAGLPVALVFWSPQSSLGEADAQLEGLAAEYGGRVLIVKVNAAEEAPLAQRYGVTHLPSFVFVKNGNVEGTLPGPLTERTVREWLHYLTEGGQRPSLPAQDQHVRGSNGAKVSNKPLHLTDRNFQEVINGDQPVLVDFWAEWCGPCRMVGPSVEQLAQEFAGRAVVAKLNIDENPQTPRRFGIMSIPTLYIFKNGQVVDQIVGAQPLPALRQWLARHVG